MKQEIFIHFHGFSSGAYFPSLFYKPYYEAVSNWQRDIIHKMSSSETTELQNSPQRCTLQPWPGGEVNIVVNCIVVAALQLDCNSRRSSLLHQVTAAARPPPDAVHCSKATKSDAYISTLRLWNVHNDFVMREGRAIGRPGILTGENEFRKL